MKKTMVFNALPFLALLLALPLTTQVFLFEKKHNPPDAGLVDLMQYPSNVFPLGDRSYPLLPLASALTDPAKIQLWNLPPLLHSFREMEAVLIYRTTSANPPYLLGNDNRIYRIDRDNRIRKWNLQDLHADSVTAMEAYEDKLYLTVKQERETSYVFSLHASDDSYDILHKITGRFYNDSTFYRFTTSRQEDGSTAELELIDIMTDTTRKIPLVSHNTITDVRYGGIDALGYDSVLVYARDPHGAHRSFRYIINSDGSILSKQPE